MLITIINFSIQDNGFRYGIFICVCHSPLIFCCSVSSGVVDEGIFYHSEALGKDQRLTGP